MKLPSSLSQSTEWTFVGPLGPTVPENLLSHPILGVDGGAHFTSKLDIWVGDADSFKEAPETKEVHRLPVDKDASDLNFALRLFSASLPYKFHFWGFLGGRKDHELFNLGEALTFLEKRPECQILLYDSSGKLAFHLVGAGDWKFTHYGIFSLGSIKNVALTLTGACQYPIKRETLIKPLSSFGLSNVGSGEMILKTQGAVFVHYPEGK